MTKHKKTVRADRIAGRWLEHELRRLIDSYETIVKDVYRLGYDHGTEDAREGTRATETVCDG
jgi:hypothetical protein